MNIIYSVVVPNSWGEDGTATVVTFEEGTVRLNKLSAEAEEIYIDADNWKELVAFIAVQMHVEEFAEKSEPEVRGGE